MIIYYSKNIDQNTIVLTEEEHRHCVKVTRHRKGDIINITDGAGTLYNGVIEDTGRHETIVDILKATKKTRLPYNLTIAIAPTKNTSRIEWFVEKAIEIGLSEIFFLHTKRTERKSINLIRLQKIAVSAMKQSMNLYLPKIHPIQPVANFTDLIPSYDHAYVAHCGDADQHLFNQDFQSNRKILVLIGPEGDFTEEEVILFSDAGCEEINLGLSRLRTETAGIIAASIIHTKTVTQSQV